MRGAARYLAGGRYTPSLPPAIVTSGTYAAWDMLPNGHQIKGTNIECWQQGIAGINVWASLWGTWAWSDGTGVWSPTTNWLKPQIDLAKSVGANCFRLFGSQYVLNDSGYGGIAQISVATYIARWRQFLDYCRAQGVYAYPTIVSDAGWVYPGTYTTSLSVGYVTAHIVQMCQLFKQYADIIPGVDIYNEASPWTASNNATATAIYNAAKAAAPTLRFTWSSPNLTPNFINGAQHDYVQLHDYVATGAGGYETLLQNWGCPIVVGEYGAAYPGRSTMWTNMSANLSDVTAGRRLAGCMQFAFADPNTGATPWGICDYQGNLRADSSSFTALPA